MDRSAPDSKKGSKETKSDVFRRMDRLLNYAMNPDDLTPDILDGMSDREKKIVELFRNARDRSGTE